MRASVRRAAASLPAPCGVIDLEAFDRNILAMAQRAGGMPIRVASKSLRTRAALERVLEHPGFRGILAFTLPEAIMLARDGHEDVVLGYPTTNRDALRELRSDAQLRERITLMIDAVEHLDFFDAVAPGPGVLRVAMEGDMSWWPAKPLLRGHLHYGVFRSSIREAAQAAAFARTVKARKGVQLVGLMAYESQVAGLPDAAHTPRGAAIRVIRQQSLADVPRRRGEMVAAVRDVVGELEFVNGGGTGSLESTSADPSVTEIAAGSGLFSPASFDRFRGFQHEAAAFFGLDVVRKPTAEIVTLHGGGWSASGKPGADRLPVIDWPRGLHYLHEEGAGEVQTPITGHAARGLEIGDRVWLRHVKAGELAERITDFAVVKGGIIEQFWKTYRGEGFAYL
ncbi:alanine racemase [Gulosibacter massiliensis]|uniref:alanine racemase n=1 Tax=Gulosibacter massiliensis TaxID=2479839 RepID=UPI000F63E0A1|nr:alanine racemase [Gulosibacter massiliensis]